ncbi:MAG: ABC transporter substrate-binding protein, partial [Candidatus Hodarchaeota archaeon]
MTNKYYLMITLSILFLISVYYFSIPIVENIESYKTTVTGPQPSALRTEFKKRVFSSYPISLIDGYNRNVTFTEEPQRIISIAPSVTEMIYAIGAGNKLVAVDINSNYPDETESLDKIDNYPTLDRERIITLTPDLILGAGITSQEDIDFLENQGYIVFILAPFGVEDVLKDIEVLGLITNHGSEASLLKNSLQERLDEVDQNVTTLTFEPKIYIEYYSEPLYTFGKGTYGHDLIELAGGINIAENATGLYPQINNEFVITQNPDLIFYATGPWTTTNLSTISSRTGWKSINAVKNGHIYPINEDWISRGGPRIVDALEEIHSKIKLVASPNQNNNVTIGFEWQWILVLIPIVVVVTKRRFSS